MASAREGSPGEPSAGTPVERPGAARLAAFATVAVLTLLAFALRYSGLGGTLPHQPELHERVFFGQVELLESDDPHPELQLDYGFYPHFVARLCTWLPEVRQRGAPRTLEEHREIASARRVHIRLVSLLVSLAIIPGTYFVARRFLDRKTSYLAVALMATSLMHLWFSQQGRPHAPAAGLALLSVAAALRMRERADFSSYLLAGITAALALSTLQSGAAVLPPLFAAHLLRRERASKIVWAWFALALAIVVISVPIFYPFLFAPTSGDDAAQASIQGVALHLSGHHVDLSQFKGAGIPTVSRGLWDYDPLILALACAGAVAALARLSRSRCAARIEGSSSRGSLSARLLAGLRGREDPIVVASYVLPYSLAIGLYAGTLERFALPLVPYECMLAAALVASGSRALAARARTPLASRALTAMPAVVVLALQGYAAVHISNLRAAPDTAEEAAQWIEHNLRRDRDRIAVLPGLNLPLVYGDEFLREASSTLPNTVESWFTYQADLSPEERAKFAWHLGRLPFSDEKEMTLARGDVPAFLSGLDADYAVIEVYDGRPPRLRRKLFEALREELQRRSPLLARFSPWNGDRHEVLPFVYENIRLVSGWCWTADALRARAMGPVIEIYRLR